MNNKSFQTSMLFFQKQSKSKRLFLLRNCYFSFEEKIKDKVANVFPEKMNHHFQKSIKVIFEYKFSLLVVVLFVLNSLIFLIEQKHESAKITINVN